jgi:arsenate reductase
MGEALLKQHKASPFHAYSAGTEPNSTVFPPVVEVMREIGIDISENKPKGIDKYLGHLYFEKVIIVCSDAEKKCPAIFGPAERLFWPFEDPAAVKGSEDEVLAVSRQVRNQLDKKICEWLNEQGIPAQPVVR